MSECAAWREAKARSDLAVRLTDWLGQKKRNLATTRKHLKPLNRNVAWCADRQTKQDDKTENGDSTTYSMDATYKAEMP